MQRYQNRISTILKNGKLPGMDRQIYGGFYFFLNKIKSLLSEKLQELFLFSAYVQLGQIPSSWLHAQLNFQNWIRMLPNMNLIGQTPFKY